MRPRAAPILEQPLREAAIAFLSPDRHPLDSPPAQPQFSLEFSRRNGDVVVAVDGELDAYTAPILGERLTDLIDAQGNLNVVLDLSATRFIDSSGLTALVTAHKSLRARGGRFAVAGPSAQVRKLLEITGLDRVLTVSQPGLSLSL